MLQPAIRLICRTEGALDPGANAPLSIHCRTRLTTPSDRFMRFSLDPRHLLRARFLLGVDLGVRGRPPAGCENYSGEPAARQRLQPRLLRSPGALASRYASAKGGGTVLIETPGFCAF